MAGEVALSRTERKNLLPGVKEIMTIDRHSRPSCHMRLSSLITHVRGPGARPARGYFLFITRFKKSPFITDIRWSASGTEIRTPIERRTVRGTADTCS